MLASCMLLRKGNRQGQRPAFLPSNTLPTNKLSMLASAIRCKGRSAWKGPFFVSFPQLAAAEKAGLPRPGTGGTPPISTTSRATTVLPNFVGLRMLVHNGKSYLPVNITPEMVGHKLGEFAPTRKPFSYRQTKNK